MKMPKACEKMRRFNQNHRSMKIPFIIYADFKCLLEKMSSCDNDPNRSYQKNPKNTVFGCSLFTHCSYNNNKNKHDFYRGGEKKLCTDLKKHSTEIISC